MESFMNHRPGQADPSAVSVPERILGQSFRTKKTRELSPICGRSDADLKVVMTQLSGMLTLLLQARCLSHHNPICGS